MENDSHLIHDPQTGDWVVVAPRRKKKPENRHASKPVDPFSTANLSKERIIATYGAGARKVIAIDNKFPVFVRGKGVSGYQELLVEGTKTTIADLLRAAVRRAKAIRKMRGIKSLIIFKNAGREAGATQSHPHSQIFALSFVPNRIRRRKIPNGRVDPATVIWEDRRAIAFAHPFARFPYEARITTVRRIDNLTQATPMEIVSLAKAIQACLPLMRARKLDYNFYFHDVFGDAHEHFEIRFTPRKGIWGGFELDAGIAVNPVPAEQAAEEYKQAGK